VLLGLTRPNAKKYGVKVVYYYLNFIILIILQLFKELIEFFLQFVYMSFDMDTSAFPGFMGLHSGIEYQRG
jgi:hypothetical protein